MSSINLSVGTSSSVNLTTSATSSNSTGIDFSEIMMATMTDTSTETDNPLTDLLKAKIKEAVAQGKLSQANADSILALLTQLSDSESSLDSILQTNTERKNHHHHHPKPITSDEFAAKIAQAVKDGKLSDTDAATLTSAFAIIQKMHESQIITSTPPTITPVDVSTSTTAS